MSRTKRFVGGVWTGLLSMVVTTIVGFWLTKFLLARWGMHDYGVWLVVGQILGYIDLLDFGVIGWLGREVASAIGRAGSIEAATDIPLLIGRMARVLGWQMPLIVAIGVGMAFLVPAQWADARRPLFALLATYVFFFPLRAFHAVLDGVQALRSIRLFSTVATLVSAAVTVWATLYGMHVGAAACGYLARNVVLTCAFVGTLIVRYSKLLPRALPPLPMTEARRIMKAGGLLTVQKLGVIFLNASDNLVVNRGLGASAVVPYSCTNKAYSVLENVPGMLLDAARPGLSEMRAGTSPDRVVNAAGSLMLGALVLAGLFASVVFTVNQGFVAWWIGDGQWAGQTTSLFLALSLVFRVWMTSLYYSSFAFSLDRQISVALMLDGFVSVVASLLLVRPFGYVGVPIGSIVGGALVAAPILLFAIARDVKVSVLELLHPLGGWAWRFVPCMVAAHFVARAWTPTRFVPLVLTATAATAVYSLVMFPCVMRSSLGERLRRFLGRA